jgi:hypothetical protein
MKNLSVLQNFTPDCLRLEPYPYIVIENALPQDIYEQLSNQYPESILNGQTRGFKDFRYYQSQFSADHVSPLWQEFVDYHTSKSYKTEVIKALEPGMRIRYPDITDKYLGIDVSLRHAGKARTTAAMEVQFVMNSADTSSIRTPHLDQGRELFACLFYMKKPEDVGIGGDLVIYEKTTKDFQFISGRLAPPDKIKPVESVPYRANTLVIFLNSGDSIHGVSPRQDANVMRRYVNIDCHVAEKLFILDYPNAA